MAIVCVYSQDHFLCGSNKNSKIIRSINNNYIRPNDNISFYDINSH